MRGTKLSEAVSIEGMAITLRWRRMLRFAAIGVGALAIALAGLIVIQKYILRWRAERLLADIRALELGKSTWADAQKIMTRWGAWGFYEGSCTAQRCTYQVAFEDVSRAMPIYSEPKGPLHLDARSCCGWMTRLYRTFRGRSTLVGARIEVIDGVVWGKNYELEQYLPSGDGPDNSPYFLVAYASSVWRRSDLGESFLTGHPEYRILRGTPCEGCEAVTAEFTPFANPSVLSNLFDFNLGCLTRHMICRHPQEIAPGMWRQADIMERIPAPAFHFGDGHCDDSPEVLGRERQSAAIARVVSVSPSWQEYEIVNEVGLQLEERLKGPQFWHSDSVYTTEIVREAIAPPQGRGQILLAPGQRVLLAFATPYDANPAQRLHYDDCTFLPLTGENLSAVRRGIAEDVFPPRPRREF